MNIQNVQFQEGLLNGAKSKVSLCFYKLPFMTSSITQKLRHFKTGFRSFFIDGWLYLIFLFNYFESLFWAYLKEDLFYFLQIIFQNFNFQLCFPLLYINITDYNTISVELQLYKNKNMPCRITTSILC